MVRQTSFRAHEGHMHVTDTEYVRASVNLFTDLNWQL